LITNVSVLTSVRSVWVATGGSQSDFDLAANILDSATCHSDVRAGLTNPPYRLTNPGRSDEWRVMNGGVLMIKYKLVEFPAAGTADVEIVP
jgi:hypothetical protein